MRRVGIFLAMTVGTAFAALGGALGLGRETQSDTGVFGIGFIAGAVAVLLIGKLLVHRRALPRQRYRAVSTGALVGLGYAVGISFFTAVLIIVPLLSFVLVGVGAVIGDVEAAHAERQASARHVA